MNTSNPTDYDRIRIAIEFLVERLAEQPSLDEVAARVGLSPFHFQRLFSRWAGVTPKRFLQVLTVERAKALLRESISLLEVADDLGLSSGSRLYDHFVHLEAVTPGEFKSAGMGVSIDYGIHATPFGPAFVAVTPRGICRLAFVGEGGVEEQLTELRRHWRHAELRENAEATAEVIPTLFAVERPDRPLSLWVAGTNFQVNVWRALLRIPPGALVSYNQIARAINQPSASRAVGTAIGANPVAVLIPCHRVIQQSGALGGYRWGEIRKHALHAWEAARF
jgi:O-6-methylguanine DNA methyltransferase